MLRRLRVRSLPWGMSRAALALALPSATLLLLLGWLLGQVLPQPVEPLPGTAAVPSTREAATAPATAPAEGAPRLPCVSYAPFRRPGHTPFDPDLRVSPAQIEADLRLLATVTGCVRTYGVSQGLEAVPAIARRVGLRVLLGAWIGSNPVDDDRELAHAIALAREHADVIDLLLVGNEVLLRGERTPIRDIYKKVQDRFPGKTIVIGETGWPSDGRMRADARPGRVEQVRYFSVFRDLADREKFDYNIVEAFDQYWKARQEGTVGAAWGLLDAQRHDKFQLGKPVSAEPSWPMLYFLSTLASGLILAAFVGLRRQSTYRAIAVFAVFAQLIATCYVQTTWIDLTRVFYFEKMMGVVFWAVLLALFSYALLRGIADSLTGRMADPSLYGARVLEAWRAWRALPRYRILQRADLMAQMLYLVLTVLCIFYLVVISIDWYDGVIRIGTWFRQIAIDGRYRDFPIWSFAIPSVVLMAWKTLTILRHEQVTRAHRWAKALSFGRLLGYDGSKGYVHMDRTYDRVRPILPEIILSALLILWAAVMVVTEGAIKLHDGGSGGLRAIDGGRWVIGTLFWNTEANWFAAIAVLMAIPYLATIYVSLREPLAEPPPDSYTNKW